MIWDVVKSWLGWFVGLVWFGWLVGWKTWGHGLVFWQFWGWDTGLAVVLLVRITNCQLPIFQGQLGAPSERIGQKSTCKSGPVHGPGWRLVGTPSIQSPGKGEGVETLKGMKGEHPMSTRGTFVRDGGGVVACLDAVMWLWIKTNGTILGWVHHPF